MRSISIQSFLSILLASSILLGQMNSTPEYSKDVKNHNNCGITIGIESLGAKNSAANYYRIIRSVFFKSRYGFSGFGAEDFNRNEMNDGPSSEKGAKQSILLWSFGTNLSSFINEEGTWQLGYNLGLTFNFTLYKKISMTLPLSYTRINASPKNVEGRSYASDGYIYKAFINREISVGFLEIPILFSYDFFSIKKYDFNYLFGIGLVIAVKDFSKLVQPKDVTITDEIIGTHDFPLDPVETRFFIPNSGLNINTGVRFHLGRLYIDVLYTLYPYKVKEINKLNSISLRLGIDIH